MVFFSDGSIAQMLRELLNFHEVLWANQVFNAFFTTKEHGTGMGLRISRTIIEAPQGGRLWATENYLRGASFGFTLAIDPSLKQN